MFSRERSVDHEKASYRWFSSTQTDRIKKWGALAAILLLAVLLRTLQLGLFHTRDELVIWRWSDEFFTALWRGNLAGSVVESDYPGITIFWLQSLLVTLKCGFVWLSSGHIPAVETIVEAPHTLPYLAERRLIMGLATSVQVWAIYALAIRAFDRRVARLATFLVALDPFFLAESRVLRAEALAAGFMILCILSFLVYLREGRRRYLALSGILAGWAILTKVTSGFLVPIVGLVLLFDLLLGRSGTWWVRLKLNVRRGIIWGGLAVASFWLSWPTLWVNPVPPLQTIFVRGVTQASQISAWHGDVFFLGRLIPDDPGLLFYPVAIAFRSTPLMWLGVALVVFGRGLLKKQQAGNQTLSGLGVRRWPSPAAGVGTLLVYIIVIFIGLSLALSKVDRYLLPILPALDILAALGLVWGADWVAERSRNPRRVMRGLVLIICLAQLWLTLPTYPYFYSYWNPLLGGGAAAVKTVPVGSGEGLDQAIDVVNRLPNAEQLTLICGASRPWCEGKFLGATWPSEVLNSGEWMRADYVLLYIAWSQRQTYPQEVVDYLSRQSLVYQVELGGATYAWLYRVPRLQYYSGTKLEGRGTLFGYDLSAAQLRAGEVLTTTLYWRNEGQRPTDAFLVEVVDAAGYPWATALAQPRPGFEEAAHTPDTIVESEAILRLPIGMPAGHYVLKMGFVTGGDQAWVGDFALPPAGDDVLVTLPGSFPAVDQIPVPTVLDFATDDVSVFGYDLAPLIVRAGQKGWLTLFWQARQDAPHDYVIGIRLLTHQGQEVTYWLGRPVYSGYATAKWSRGQVVQDPWELAVPESIPPGNYLLELTLFDSTNGEALARTPLGPWTVIAP